MTAPDDGGVGAGTAVMRANQSALASHPEQTRTPSSVVHEFPAPSAERASTPFHLTDWGNAKRLVGRFGPDTQYEPTSKKWFVWNGQRWVVDQTGEVCRLAKETVRFIYREAANASSKEERKALAAHANRSESAARIGAMIHLASTEPGIPVTPDQLDTDPWALNVLNGTLDLRTGKLRDAFIGFQRHLYSA